MIPSLPDQLKNNVDNQLPSNATWFSVNTVNQLTDIFAEQTNSFLKKNTFTDISTMYAPVIQNILRTWSASAIEQLKVLLYGNTTHALDIKDIKDMTISLSDLAQAISYQQIAHNIPDTHNAVYKDVFLSALDTIVKTFPAEQQIVYQQTVISRLNSIVSLDTLWKALQKFDDECVTSGWPLQNTQKESMMSVTITFGDVLQHPSTKIIIPSTENQQQLLPGLQKTDLFDSYATIFGVSSMHMLIKKVENNNNRTHAMSSFVWEDLFMQGINMNEQELAQQNTTYKAIVQDATKTAAEKHIAKLHAVVQVMKQMNVPYIAAFEILIKNNCDFGTLPDAQQKEYMLFVKTLWLQSEAWKDLVDYVSTFDIWEDLVGAYIDALFSTQNENIPFIAHDGNERMISIQKKVIQSNNPENNINTIMQYWLPFAITLKWDCFDAQDIAALHNKNDWCRADRLPHALTMMVWATKLKLVSPEMAWSIIKQMQQQLHQHTLAADLSWITTVDPTIEDVDWEDESVVDSIPLDDLTQAKRYYKKKLEDIRKEIKLLAVKEKSKEKELETIFQTINGKNNISKDRLDELKATAEKIENELWEILSRKEYLTELQQEANQIQKIIATEVHKREKQHHEEAVRVADADEETKWTIKPIEEAVENIDPLEAMKNRWSKISWEKGAPLEVGSILCIELPDIQWPLVWWKRPWATWEIIRVEDDWTFEIVWKWLDEPLHGKTPSWKSLEWSSSIVTDPSGIDMLDDRVWKMWKFAKRNSWQEFWIALKENNLDVDKEFKDHLGNLLQKVDFGSMYRKTDWVVDKNDSWNKIKYLSGNVDDLVPDEKTKQDVVKNQKVWYELEQQKDGVLVKGKDRDGNPYEKLMSPQEFVVFVADKWLYTYTQNEVDEINKKRDKEGLSTLQDEIDRSFDIPARQKMLWTNLNAIKHCFKFGFDGIKKWLKKKQEKDSQALEDMMLWSSWFRGLAKVPIIWKAFEEMFDGKDKEADQAIAKEIKEAQEEPDKAWEETKDWPYNFILWDWNFEKVAWGWVLTIPKDIRKFAWYYLYVLSKWSQYPQTLAKYDWQWVWVRGLLWPKYQEQYLSHIKRLQDIVEKNPNDGDAQKQLSLWEFGFLKKVYWDGSDDFKARLNKVFGKAYFTKTLWSFDWELFSNKVIWDAQEKAKWKMFSEASADYTKAVKERKILDMYGTLKWMWENIKSDQLNYSQWMMRLAYPILAWITVNNMDAGMRKDYELLARQYLTPFGLFAKETDWPRKLWSLIDVVTEHAGIWESFLTRFKKFAPTASELRPTEWQQLEFYNELNTWWFQHGDTVLDIIGSQHWKLFQIKQNLQEKYDTEIDLDKKQDLLNKINLIWIYIDKKVLDDSKDSVETKLWGVVAEKNIMNFSEWSFRQLLDYNNGSFSKDLVESWPKARKALTKQIKDLNNSDKKAWTDLYQFVLKKFVMFFESKWHFATANASSLLAALKYAHKDKAMTVYIMNRIDPQDKAPKEVKDAIIAFQDFFSNQKPSDEGELIKILDAVLWKWAWDDYKNLNAKKVKKSTKKQKDLDEVLLTEDIMSELWVNYLIDDNWDKLIIYKDDRIWDYRIRNGNIIKKVQWKKWWQNSKEVKFQLIDEQWRVTKTLSCFDFREAEVLPFPTSRGDYDDDDWYPRSWFG